MDLEGNLQRGEKVTCEHCKKRIDGAAQIDREIVLHEDCCDEYYAIKEGRPHRCPVCDGSGVEYDRDVHSVELYDPSDGYNGWGTPLNSRVVTRHEKKDCEFCKGRGFLAKKPTPIMRPAQEAAIIGWTHES